MKRYLIGGVLIFALFLTTACGKDDDNETQKGIATLTCTSSETDEDGFKTDNTVVISYKESDNKITKITETSLLEMDPTLIDTTISLSETFASSLNQIEGMDMKFSKESDNVVKSVTEVDYTKLDVEALKSAFGGDDSFDTNVDITLEEYKSTNLEGYTCN